MSSPAMRFVSLFVADLAAAARRYEQIFGVVPTAGASQPCAPNPHPYAAAGPIVFRLGEIELALYQADGRVTHPGDVGLGVVAPPAELARRAAKAGARVLSDPAPMPGDGRELAVFMLPERHFFEIVGPTAGVGPSAIESA